MTKTNLADRLLLEHTPLFDGNQVTFLWRGEHPPLLMGDHTNWEENPLALTQTAPGIWTYTLTLSPDAYFEYAFLDPQTASRIPDPFNPRRISNGLGYINHFFYMPNAAPHPLTRRHPSVPRGVLTRHTVHAEWLAAGRSRRIDLYRPPVTGPVPLLVVYDGDDFAGRGRLPIIVDNLIARGDIRPIAMAFVHNHHIARTMEYACSDLTLGLLLDCVLPLAAAELDLLDTGQYPGAYGILGASMGGLMAFYTGLRLPHIFGHVLAQSGAYIVHHYEFVLLDLVRYFPLPALQLWLDVGLYEFLLEANRRMHAVLEERAFPHTYREYPAGHNYTSWRNDVWRGLQSLFPPLP